MLFTYYKKPITNKTPYKNVSLNDVYNAIRGEYFKPQTDFLRTLSDKSENSKFKQNNFDFVVFAGTFKGRTQTDLIDKSGFIVIDFDHILNVDILKNRLLNDKLLNPCLLFRSPNGDGLKLVLQYEKTFNHTEIFLLLEHYFLKVYQIQIDKSGKNIDRVCFLCYDPEVYLPFDLKSIDYNELTKIKIESLPKDQPTKQNEFGNDLYRWCENVIKKSESFVNGNRNNYITKLSLMLNDYGLSQNEALTNLYSYSCSDFTAKEIENTVKSIYLNHKSNHGVKEYKTLDKTIDNKIENKSNKNAVKQIEPEELDKLIIERTIKEGIFYKQSEPVLKIRKNYNDEMDLSFIRLFTKGNISVITGKAKSKKTFLQTIFASSLYSAQFNELLLPERNLGNIFYLDTEQSKFDVFNVYNRIKRFVGSDIEKFALLSLRGLNHTFLIDMLSRICNNYGQYTDLIIIDQVADFMKSINNEEEAVQLVKLLEQLSNDFDLHISCVVHQNKLNDYAMGWLGTQLMKKAETVIKVTKDEQNKIISKVEPDLMRGEEFEPFKFMINDDGLPKLVKESEVFNVQTRQKF